MIDITERLRKLSIAVSEQNWQEFSMRVPAEPDRDADIVIMQAAMLIESLRQQLSSRDAEIEGHKGRFAKDQDRIACQAEQLAQKNAEITECDALRDRMSEILSATAIAINGPEPELTKWSWHDLSEKAGALKQQVAELVAALVEIRDDFDCDKDAHKYGTTCRCCLANATLAKVRKP